MSEVAVAIPRAPATSVGSAGPVTDQPSLLTGRAFVPAHDCWYPPSVEVADMLLVDFDCREVGPDGLYLVEELVGRGVVWRGCRRFARKLNGTLELDSTGRGEWIDAPPPGAWNWRIAGRVERVYRPTT